MTFQMSEEAQIIQVFNLSASTNEFIGAGDAYIAPHTGLPAHCTDIEPPEAMLGYVAVYNPDKAVWSIVEDHRGMTAYDIDTGAALYISELGPLPDNVTVISPEGEFQKWDGKAWVKDETAEKTAKVREAESTKDRLMQEVTERILPLQDAFELGMATDEEKFKLIELKKYRVLLNRVDVAKPDWPTKIDMS